MEPTIIYEDESCVALNKPPGMLMHAARHMKAISGETTVADWLRNKYPEIGNVGDDPVHRPGIVHRLDKETSGVVIVAKTQEYFEYLKSLFQRHEMQKTYIALVRGKLREPEGRVDAPIGIVSGSIKRSTRSAKMSKPATTTYKVLREAELPSGQPVSLLAVSPKTGRTHQIRVHCASIGHPVIGDRLYGGKQDVLGQDSRLMLHALSMEFSPSPGKRIKIEAPAPPEFTVYLSTPQDTV
jgi:23S rRNA pseudouridine1911/1915/1917 synthase